MAKRSKRNLHRTLTITPDFGEPIKIDLARVKGVHLELVVNEYASSYWKIFVNNHCVLVVDNEPEAKEAGDFIINAAREYNKRKESLGAKKIN